MKLKLQFTASMSPHSPQKSSPLSSVAPFRGQQEKHSLGRSRSFSHQHPTKSRHVRYTVCSAPVLYLKLLLYIIIIHWLSLPLLHSQFPYSTYLFYLYNLLKVIGEIERKWLITVICLAHNCSWGVNQGSIYLFFPGFEFELLGCKTGVICDQ